MTAVRVLDDPLPLNLLKDPNPMDVYIIPIVGMLIPIIIVPTALGFKHARYLRQMEHAERMKSLDLGQPLAEDQSWTTGSYTFLIAMTIGGVVPIAAMFIAYIAAPEQGGSDAIWMAAGMIGVAGVICGSILAAQSFARQGQASTTSYAEKAAFDPEAFEPVGHRG
jgi:NhaP-type Na+/H+ or K+/H+ antiporter